MHIAPGDLGANFRYLLSDGDFRLRSLRRYNVPAEFVVYPRDPQGLRERKHIADRYRRSLDWIAKYLGPVYK